MIAYDDIDFSSFLASSISSFFVKTVLPGCEWRKFHVHCWGIKSIMELCAAHSPIA